MMNPKLSRVPQQEAIQREIPICRAHDYYAGYWATGEDKNLHDRHVKLMQLEERKVSPDLKVLADLMMRTFSIRRIRTVDELTSF